jgi:hypothetical protein
LTAQVIALIDPCKVSVANLAGSELWRSPLAAHLLQWE